MTAGRQPGAPPGGNARPRRPTLPRRVASLLLVGGALLAGSAAAEPAIAAPGWSLSLLDRDTSGRTAFVARPWAGTVVALEVATTQVRWERALGGRPQVILYAGGAEPRLFVAGPGTGVAVLDPATGDVRQRLPVGSTPCGLARFGARYLAVSLQPPGRVVVWDLEAGRIAAEREVAPHPCHLAALPPSPVGEVGGESPDGADGTDDGPAGSRLAVTHSLVPPDADGRPGVAVTLLSLPGLEARGTVRGEAALNQTAGVLAAPDGRHLFLPHVLSHDVREDPKYVNALHPAVSVMDVAARELVSARRIEPAFADRPVNGPGPVALFRDGKALLVIHPHSNDLSAFSLESGLTVGHVQVGRYPQGVVVSPEGGEAWVADAHDHTLSIVDLESFQVKRRLPYGSEPLPPAVARGRDLFHDAASPRMARLRWLVCANCHPGGGGDGRTWNLPGRGRLLTKDLRGIGATLPAGWLGDRDELQDEELFIRGFLRGEGLAPHQPHPARGTANRGLSDDLDALAAFLAWLPPPAGSPPAGAAGKAAVERGRRLFHAAEVGCAACHPPPRYTLSGTPGARRHAGLVTPRASHVPFDVPSLRGLAHRSRFLHDGRARGLREVLTRWNVKDRHGRTSHLRPLQVDDLVAFLLSLPAAADPPAGAAEGGGEMQTGFRADSNGAR